MTNINLQFTATSNMGPVRRDIQKLTADFQRLNAAQVASQNNSNVRATRAQLAAHRDQLLQTAQLNGQFAHRQVQALSATEQFTKALRDQKVHFLDAIKNRKLLNSVIREQIALQRATALTGSTDSRGRIRTDLIVPNFKDNIKDTMRSRAALSVYSHTLASVADQTVKLGKNMQWAGRQLTVGFTVPMTIAAAATGKLAYDMDKSLTQITKVYGDANSAAQDSVEYIRESSMNTAKNMASLYGQSAADTLEIVSQFAAAGKTGVELQQAAAAATKARMLAEIDLQDSIDASIAMQTIYGYSAEELGEKWNYINAMENQTVLTAQDFATAIPKVAGVLKELGGTVEDLGVLMTAFKAGGIDAAEGANALKTISFRAVATYSRGLKTFQEKTGKDLKKIIAETNGETIPTLNAMFKQIESLNAADRIAVVKDVFGIYQGNKALIVMEQMAKQAGQVGQALAVGKNSVAENAAIANQELLRMNQQPFKKIEKAVESIKITLGEIGADVLPLVVQILQGVGSLVNSFSEMAPWKKQALLIAAGFIAIAGPVTMVIGMFGNLTGLVQKAAANFGLLVSRMKLLTPEERAQELSAKRLAGAFGSEAQAAERLVTVMEQLRREYALINHNNAVGFGLPSAAQSSTAAAFVAANGATGRRDPATGKFVSKARAAELRATHAATQAAHGLSAAEDQVAESTRNRFSATQKLLGASVAASMATSMMTDTDSTFGKSVDTIATSLMAVSALSMTMPGTMSKIGAVAKRSFGSMASKVGVTTTALRGAGAAASSIGAAALAAGPAIAAVGVTAGFVYYKMSQAAEEHAKKMEQLKNSATTWSELFSYNKMSTPKLAQQMAKTGEDAANAFAEEFKRNSPDAFEMMRESVGDDYSKRMGAAIAEGSKAMLTGASKETALQIVRSTLAALGKSVSDQEWATISAKITLDPKDIAASADTIVQGLKTQIDRAISDNSNGFWEGLARVFSNGSMTEAGSQAAQEVADTIWNAYFLADESARSEILEKSMSKAEEQLRAKFAELQKVNVYAAGDFSRYLKDLTSGEIGPGTIADSRGVTDAFTSDLQRQADALAYISREIAKKADITDEDTLSTIRSSDELERQLQILENSRRTTEAFTSATPAARKSMEEYTNAVFRAGERGETLSDSQKLAMLNSYRMSNGLAAVSSAADGYSSAVTDAADASQDLAAAIQSSGLGAMGFTEDDLIAKYKERYTGAMDSLFSAAENLASSSADRQAAYLDRAMDSAMSAYDKKADSLTSKMEAAEKRLEKVQDARIARIESAIEREKSAQEKREELYRKEIEDAQRAATLFERGIDINAAISTGNFDEAARLQGETAAEQKRASIEAAQEATKKASDARIAQLEKERDLIQERAEAEKESLKASQDAAKKRLELERDAANRYWQTRKETNAAVTRDRQRNLQIELDTLRAFIPRNDKELYEQAARIEATYKKYGVTLQGQGKSWSQIIAKSLETETEKARASMASDAGWKDVGAEVTKAILKGGFGMTMEEFSKWLNGGAAPSTSVLSPNYKKPRTASSSVYGGGGQTRHSGGMVNFDSGKRTGFSGSNLHPAEIPITARLGEAVITREAAAALGGKRGVDALNAGKLPVDTGPWGGQAAMPVAMIAAATKRVMAQSLFKVASVRRGGEKAPKLSGGLVGSYDTKSFGAGIDTSQYIKQVAAGIIGGGAYTGPMSSGWARPTAGGVGSEYGLRFHPILKIWRLHAGTDIGGAMGQPIWASKSGLVVYAGPHGGHGNYVLLDHGNGERTGYAHQSKIAVSPGQKVTQGQVIGYVGSTGLSTGPHLHFEYYRGGQTYNPRSILPQLRDGGYTWNTGLAELHPGETVLTSKLSDKLHIGIDKIAQGEGGYGKIVIDMRNSSFSKDIDVERAVERALEKSKRSAGSSRKVST